MSEIQSLDIAVVRNWLNAHYLEKSSAEISTLYRLKTGTLLTVTDGHIISGFENDTDYTDFVFPLDLNSNPIIPDFTGTWEIGAYVKVPSYLPEPIGVCGQTDGLGGYESDYGAGYAVYPIIEVSGTYMYDGYIDGESIGIDPYYLTDGNIPEPEDGYLPWLFFKVGYDGTKNYVALTYDFDYWVTDENSWNINKFTVNDGIDHGFAFGAFNAYSSLSFAHRGNGLSIDLYNTYIKTNGSMIWGQARYSE